MRIVFMGTPEFAVPTLEILIFNRSGVIAVYTQPDKEAGRGRFLAASPVKSLALKCQLPVYQPVDFKSVEERERLAALKPDVIVVAAYGQILPDSILRLPRYGCLNIHPSLLPKYRGVSPVPAAILSGDEFTGVSIMMLDSGVDTGPVLVQAQVSVTEWDTTASLMEKLARIGAQLLIEVLPRWMQGKVLLQNQDDTKATYTHMIDKADGEINWHQPAMTLWRQVRAYQPWPGSYTRWMGKQLKVIEAIPIENRSDTPGRVVLLSGNSTFGVQTGLGGLGILRVQIEGKRIMSGAEFLRGQRQLIGSILPA